MNSLTATRRFSRRLRLLMEALLVLYPLSWLGVWAAYNHLPMAWREAMMRQTAWLPSRLTWDTIGLLYVAGLPRFLVAFGILFCLRRLFRLYEAGNFFELANVVLYRRLGTLFLVGVVASVLSDTLGSVALTLHNPPGQRMLTVGLSSDHLQLLFVGLVAMALGRVMEQGRLLQDDAKLTV